MAYTYDIRVKKEKPDSVKRKCPPGFANQPDYVNVDKFKSDKKLWKASDKQLRKLLKKRLDKLGYNDLNQKYDYEQKEQLFLVKDYNSSDPVFEAEIEIPEHLRDEHEKKGGKKSH